MKRLRAAVLISGRGSNMMALAEAARAPDYPVTIACVISNRPDAEGLAYAARHGIAAKLIDHREFASREGFEAALDRYLRAEAIDLIACAGFMRVLTGNFVSGWEGRMINIHPSLLPAYKGLQIARQVGLIPLERDPASGLWEFLLADSGAAPSRRPAFPRWPGP